MRIVSGFSEGRNTQVAFIILGNTCGQLSANVHALHGAVLVLARKPAEAMPHLLRAKELDPQDA